MPSFGTLQNSLIGSGFLDGNGESKGNFEGLRLDKASQLLAEIVGDFAKNVRENLNTVDRVSSGALDDSIIPLPLQIMGKKIIAEVKVLDYYKFIDKGVKGTKGGAGKYGFKNDRPSKEMVSEIRKWIIREGIKITNTKVAINSREKKRLSSTDRTGQLAYGIARSIKQKGLKPTNFWTDAENELRRKLKEKMGAALKIDVINSLNA